jgi:hypothetical protein
LDIDSHRRTLKVARRLTVLKTDATEAPTKTHQRRDLAIDDGLDTFLVHGQTQQRQCAQKVVWSCARTHRSCHDRLSGSVPCLPRGLTRAYARLAAKQRVGGLFPELRHESATTAVGIGMGVPAAPTGSAAPHPSVALNVHAHALEARDRELAGLPGTPVLGPMDRSVQPDEADTPAPADLDRAGELPRRAKP